MSICLRSAWCAVLVSACIVAGSVTTAHAQSVVPSPYVGKQRAMASGHSGRGVDQALGTFNESLPIAVPAFHAITPQISIAYDSSAKNGWTGTGWSLNGLSRIERVTPGRGSPNYDSADTFMLDGQELVACVTGSVSPSCTSGGGYATKNESYSKIYFTAANSSWTVVAKDGTQSIYTPSFTVSSGTDGVWHTADDSVFRWGLHQVIDTRGNTVTYNWAGDNGSVCDLDCTWDYPDSITYNGTTIKFYYEDRADEETSAAGLGTELTVLGRVKTIDVTVSGSRARAYKLTYTTSGATGRSLLSSVQEFGKDATLDASGAVTGGTSWPAVTLGYQSGTPSFVGGTSDTGTTYDANAEYIQMDVNGDGKQDVVEIYPYVSWFVWYWGRRTWISNGTSFTQASSDTGLSYASNARFLPMDVNGDGKQDVVELYPYDATHTGRRVWLSNGTGFTLGPTITNWAVPFTADQQFLSADVNGDGKMDLIEAYPYNSGANIARQVHLSTGTDFTYGAIDGWANLGQKLYALDINGDGKTDVVHVYPFNNGANEARQVYISQGNSGFALGQLEGLLNLGQQFLHMDINGDGKEVAVNVYPDNNNTSTSRQIWLSTGTGFVAAGLDGWTYCCSNKFLSADVNGDGKTDMIEMYPGTNYFGRQIWISTGTSYTRGAFDGNQLTVSSTTQFLSLDVNGDGLGDMLELKPSGGTMTRKIWSVGGSFPDLLTSEANGWGGVTTVSYTPSSAWTNTNLPWVLQTATAVTGNDGRGSAPTTSYSYGGGIYDWSEGRFMGFRSARETLPCITGETSCPYNDSLFKQDANAVTNLERVDRKSGSGTLLASNVHEYTTNGTTIPRTALETGTWEYTYAGTGTPCPGAGCKRTYTTHAYNAYGEVTQETEYGDYDVTGDERTTVTVFVPNTTAYIVDVPAYTTLYQGVGTGGAALNQTVFWYDGATTWNQAPATGFPTAMWRWLSSSNTYLTTQKQYDGYGNLTADIDELGNRTTYTYDTTYHVFAVTKVNALLQDVTATWDPVCGAATQTTDLNHQVSTATYDKLCRVSQTTSPGGKFENFTWVNVGNPATQYVQVDRPAADGTSNPLWSRNYFDGLQRSWRTVQKGPATGDVFVDKAFNARGAIALQTLPFYGGQTMYVTANGYDSLDRLVNVTYPDAAYTTKSYDLWSVTEADELGHAKRDRFNAYGKRIAHDEIVGGVVTTTTFAYDARQNLQQTIDPAGNSNTQTVDSLGRVTQLVDLDWGTSNYEYDSAGRLTATTDAKGQRTTFGYDALGRKISKTTNAGTPQAATVSWAYDQARSSFYNTGALTTMTDAAGTKTLDHDAAGRTTKVVRTINGTPYTFQHGYDAGDRPLWTIYPDGDTLGTLVYDSAGRLVSIPGYVTSASYNAEGSLTGFTNANGTVTTRPHSAQRGWLTGIATTSGGATIQNLVYTKNTKGLVTGITSPISNEGWTFAKDELDRMTGATNASSATYSQTFAYDAIGNITSNSRLGAYTYHATKKHAVLTAGANTYAYDAAGLMTSGAGRTITWNGDNQVATVTSGSTTMTMTYDADGMRIMQVEGATGRVYLGDDYEIDGGTTTKYVSLGGVPVARKAGTTKTWIHADQLGSIQAETDASGVEVHRKKYFPFGESLSTSGTLSYEPRGYTAQRHDASGLVYLHARFYDPALGRFLSPDRIVDGPNTVGLNRYAYVANDPVDATDITGFAQNVSRPSTKASPQTKAPSSNNSKGQNNNSGLNAAKNVSSSGPGGATNANRSSDLPSVNTSPGATRTTQIRSASDGNGGITLTTQHSTHYFAPPPPPPSPPTSYSTYATYTPSVPVPSASSSAPSMGWWAPPVGPTVELVVKMSPLPQSPYKDCLNELDAIDRKVDPILPPDGAFASGSAIERMCFDMHFGR